MIKEPHRIRLFLPALAIPLILFFFLLSSLAAASPDSGATYPAGPQLPSSRGTEIVELLANHDFDDGFAPWWATSSVTPEVDAGTLRAAVTAGGGNPWDAIVGQHNIPVQAGERYTVALEAWASTGVIVTVLLQQDGGAYTRYFEAPLPLTTTPQEFSFTFTAPANNPAASFQFHLGAQGEYDFHLSVVSLRGPSPGGSSSDPLPVVRLNQTGYFPGALKRATISNSSAEPLSWTLYDLSDEEVASGMTEVAGLNEASGEHVHIADFSTHDVPGTGYTLEVNGERSYPFDIGADIYEMLKYDAMAYFYHNRSGITLTMPYAGDEQWSRPAGHLPDVATCFDQVDTTGKQWEGCDYTLDVTGGWYDAGDHGKYVVNGGISLWTMLNQYERALFTPGADTESFADGTMNIPENNNGVPDILDEARWQLEFLLSMQVPEGGMVEGVLREGMVHHKIHDMAWTGLGLAPHEDPMTRYLYPPSTAATLNVAATGAQCARIWESIDPPFAARCLAAAERAWDAALANPEVYAANNFTGGGPYDDTDVSDEFYWAAAELFITTGEVQYEQLMRGSEHFLKVPTRMGAQHTPMTWRDTAALGTISLAIVPGDLTAPDRERAREGVIMAADLFAGIQASEGYGLPFGAAPGGYPWGSNSFVLNNLLIMALAYDFSEDSIYLDGVVEGMDYLLGRNPMDKSYVTGYGERPLENPHHRFWAHQSNDKYPSAPPGAISGGPNSGLEDPYARALLLGCPPQKCYVDHIEAWSTNEITINWNAPFAWVVAFLDEAAGKGPSALAMVEVRAGQATPAGGWLFATVLLLLAGMLPLYGRGQIRW